MPALEEAVSELGGVVVSAVLVLLSAAEAVIDASLWLRDVSLSFRHYHHYPKRTHSKSGLTTAGSK